MFLNDRGTVTEVQSILVDFGQLDYLVAKSRKLKPVHSAGATQWRFIINNP